MGNREIDLLQWKRDPAVEEGGIEGEEGNKKNEVVLGSRHQLHALNIITVHHKCGKQNKK